MSHPSFWHVIGANDCIVQPVAQSPQSHTYCDITAAATVNPAAAASLPVLHTLGAPVVMLPPSHTLDKGSPVCVNDFLGYFLHKYYT